MSRMLKALSRIGDKSGAEPESLAPLSSAELAELNAKLCREATGKGLSDADSQPGEAVLDRAEQLLRDVAEVGQAAIGRAEKTSDPDVLESSFEIRVSDDYPWRVGTVCQPAPAHCVFLVKSARFELPPPAPADKPPKEERQREIVTGTMPASDSGKKTIDLSSRSEVAVLTEPSWVLSTLLRPAPATSILQVDSPRMDKQPPAAKRLTPARPGNVVEVARPRNVPAVPEEKLRRQYQQVAEQLLKDVSATDSALLLFSHVDQNAPTATFLGPLAAVLSELDAGEVLFTEAHFGRGEVSEYFSSDPHPGLADYLQSVVAWEDLPVTKLAARLSILPGGIWQTRGKAPPAGVDLNDRVAELKSMYRLVLVDATGLSQPAARGLVAAADSVYLFATLGYSTSDKALQAQSAVRAGGGQVSGCILLYSPVAA